MIEAGIVETLVKFGPNINDNQFIIDVLWTMTNIVSIHVGSLINEKHIDRYLL